MIRETAELSFETTLGGTRVIRIPNPVANVTPILLGMSESLIRQSNPFDATVGGLVELKRAQRVTVERVPLVQQG
jgi:hypothetical protein